MKLLVSACLLGLSCRYDGRAKEDPAILALAQTHTLIPFCPEVYGGLSTPREPSERREGGVFSQSGADVTAAFEKGAQEALRICQTLSCTGALLKERSPSCGVGVIYDGRFTGTLIAGNGLTAQRLAEHGIRVLPASRVSELEE